MAQHRHKRETNARRPKAIQVAGPIAIMATVSAVSLGVLTATPRADEFLAASSSGATAQSSTVTSVDRSDIVSRSESRLLARKEAKREAKREVRREAKQLKLATRRAIRRADTKMWTTAELNLWSGPEKQADKVGVLDGIEKVLITGRKDNGRVEVVIKDQSSWVTAGYLSKKKPETGSHAGRHLHQRLVGVQRRATGVVLVHEAVCANFPQITSYGTFRGDGEHAQGRAVDMMISGETGWQVADFLRANYAALDIEIHHLLPATSGPWTVRRGLARRCPTAGRSPPTTTTTCTSLSTDTAGAPTRCGERAAQSVTEQRESLDRFIAGDQPHMPRRDAVAPNRHGRCGHLVLEQPPRELGASSPDASASKRAHRPPCAEYRGRPSHCRTSSRCRRSHSATATRTSSSPRRIAAAAPICPKPLTQIAL